jgi:hypothetical protein
MAMKQNNGRCWLVTAASQAGMTHVGRGEPCADAFAIGEIGAVLVLALADGAGSARFGGQAARFAVQEAVRVSRALYPNGSEEREPCEFLREVFRGTLAGLLHQISAWRDALAEPLRLSDYHTTLLLAVVSDSHLLVGNIGDGWLIARGGDGIARAVAPPPRGEYCNETFFLTSEHAIEDAVCEAVSSGDLDAIALLSDGTSWFAVDLEARQPGQALFDNLFRFAADREIPVERKNEDLADFLASDLVCRKTDDDTTLMLAVRMEILPDLSEGGQSS